MKQIKRLFEIDPWKIRTTKLDRENRRLQESLTSIGNGYMGMRGNFEETYSADHHQGTYILNANGCASQAENAKK